MTDRKPLHRSQEPVSAAKFFWTHATVILALAGAAGGGLILWTKQQAAVEHLQVDFSSFKVASADEQVELEMKIKDIDDDVNVIDDKVDRVLIDQAEQRAIIESLDEQQGRMIDTLNRIDERMNNTRPH